MRIGFFDSGLGGLTIMKAVAKHLPQYDYVFYGDTANLPYGDKAEEEIYNLTITGMEYLFEDDCSLVIIACNTASAETARRIQTEFLPAQHPDKKVLGIIVPTIEELLETKDTKVAMLATKRTVESNKYQIELTHKGSNSIQLKQIATPGLVPLIETGELETATSTAISIIETQAQGSEVVILGCSHYTQIKDSLRDHFLDKKIIISQDEVIPDKIKSYLDQHPEIESHLTHKGERNIHLTQHRPDYDHLMGQLLGGVSVDKTE